MNENIENLKKDMLAQTETSLKGLERVLKMVQGQIKEWKKVKKQIKTRKNNEDIAKVILYMAKRVDGMRIE